MKNLLLILLLPALAMAQEFQFQFLPGAFPVQIGNWQPFQPWSEGMCESTPEFCDIDNDGLLELFVGNYQGSIWYFENTGSPQRPYFVLVTKQYANVNTGGSLYVGRTGPKFCDLDGDGDLDLFTSDGRGLVHYWENQGTPTIPNFVHITDSLGGIDVPGMSYLDLCDIDADGDYDLFISAALWGTIYFFRNTGTPQQWNFQQESTQFASINVGDHPHPRFVDIDGDGVYDLFVGNGYGNVYYYHNDGTPQQWDFHLMTSNFLNLDVGDLAAPEFADIDGDSSLDFFCGMETDWNVNNQGDIYYYHNAGTPQQSNFQYVTNCYTSIDEGVGSQPFLVDLDADGDKDLVIACGHTLRYYRNDNGVFVYVPNFFPQINIPDVCPFFCDIDADGDYDLFCGSSAIPGPPHLYYYRNEGTPQVPNFALISSNLIVNNNFFVLIFPYLVDIDADGDYDLFLADQNHHFFYYRNMGTPTNFNFALYANNWQNIAEAYPMYGCFYDLDEDGTQDLVYGSWQTNNLVYYHNTGTPQVPIMTWVTDSLLSNKAGMVTCDFPRICDMDDDGDGDLFIGSYNGGVAYFRNVTGETPVGPRCYPHKDRRFDLVVNPQPGNPSTGISFTLPSPQNAELSVYNLLGAKIATLVSGYQPAGTKTIVWNAFDKASGVYIVRLQAGEQIQAAKVVVVR
jgi:hypothetical protein